MLWKRMRKLFQFLVRPAANFLLSSSSKQGSETTNTPPELCSELLKAEKCEPPTHPSHSWAPVLPLAATEAGHDLNPSATLFWAICFLTYSTEGELLLQRNLLWNPNATSSPHFFLLTLQKQLLGSAMNKQVESPCLHLPHPAAFIYESHTLTNPMRSHTPFCPHRQTSSQWPPSSVSSSPNPLAPHHTHTPPLTLIFHRLNKYWCRG